jgi:hypothetical protein
MNRAEQTPPPEKSSIEPSRSTESSPPPPAEEPEPRSYLKGTPPEPAQEEGAQQNEVRGSAPEPAQEDPSALPGSLPEPAVEADDPQNKTDTEKPSNDQLQDAHQELTKTDSQPPQFAIGLETHLTGVSAPELAQEAITRDENRHFKSKPAQENSLTTGTRAIEDSDPKSKAEADLHGLSEDKSQEQPKLDLVAESEQIQGPDTVTETDTAEGMAAGYGDPAALRREASDLSSAPSTGTSRGSQDSPEARFIHDASVFHLSSRQEAVGWSGPSQAEIELRQREPIGYEVLDPDNHTNKAYKIKFRGELRGMFKPEAGELPIHDNVPAGTYWQREIATFRLDEMLGFHLVPPTTNWRDDILGDGSIQQWIEEALPGKDISRYGHDDADRMAVLDYIIANTDRHQNNYLTNRKRPVAIDNGCTFPESATVPIRSDWVVSRLKRPLSASVMAQVNQVDTNALRGALRDVGLSNEAINGAVARLNEIKNYGMIIGQAWPGNIANANWNLAFIF